MTRREFFQVLGVGIVVSVMIPEVRGQRSRGRRVAGPAERLHVASDGTITVLTSKVEVGQGSRTQILQAAAEELKVDLKVLRLVMADSAVCPDDGGTAGSRTTPSTVPAVRQACAATRQWLMEAAAKRFGVPIDRLTMSGGVVRGPEPDQRLGYSDIVENLVDSELEGEDVDLTPTRDWRVLGLPIETIQGKDIVTGRHRYPSDIRLPEMLFGAVLRAPAMGAEMLSVDPSAGESIAGVTVLRDGEFVGCAGPTGWQAQQAVRAIAETAQWRMPPQAVDSDALWAALRESADVDRARTDRRGDPEAALERTQVRLQHEYRIPYVQHAPMEPRAAVAQWSDGDLTVWTGTQQPSRVQGQLAEAFRIPRERVRLIVPDTGGGFGGKHTGEAALEAARLSLAAGKPVSLRWTREEEFTWAYYRPAALMTVAAGLDGQGRIDVWSHVMFNAGTSAIESPYEIPHVVTEYRPCRQPLRSGSYRALASTANVFARESMMDELASAAGRDPLAFRLQQLKNERLRAVLEAAAERFDWDSTREAAANQEGVGVGLACGIEKSSYVAAAVRVWVDRDRGRFRLEKITQAFECGAVQNPRNLKSQIEGCILQGLGPVMGEEIRFRDGKVLNPRFSAYPVPRFRDLPEIEVVLVNRSDLPSVGAGETPIVAVAPAVANAIFHGTGVRPRSLPIRLTG